MSGEIIGNEVRTAGDGSFAIPVGSDPSLVLVVADDCFAFRRHRDTCEIAQAPGPALWTCRGRYLIGDRPGVGKPIKLLGILRVTPSKTAW